MALRKVIQAGDPRLKNKNKLVKDTNAPYLQKLIKDLARSMLKTGLVGIAAPQIGENYMVFATYPRNTKARKLPKADKLRIYINPKITYLSKTENIIYEGCGSLGDIFGPVLRPSEVEVEAYDEKGQKFSLKADGILARIIQHEMDHLNGIEFIQKVNDYNKIIVKDFYVKNIRNSVLQKKNSTITKVEYKSL